MPWFSRLPVNQQAISQLFCTPGFSIRSDAGRVGAILFFVGLCLQAEVSQGSLWGGRKRATGCVSGPLCPGRVPATDIHVGLGRNLGNART